MAKKSRSKKKKVKSIPMKKGAKAVHTEPKQQFITNVYSGGQGSRGGKGAYKKAQPSGVAPPSSRKGSGLSGFGNVVRDTQFTGLVPNTMRAEVDRANRADIRAINTRLDNLIPLIAGAPAVAPAREPPVIPRRAPVAPVVAPAPAQPQMFQYPPPPIYNPPVYNPPVYPAYNPVFRAPTITTTISPVITVDGRRDTTQGAGAQAPAVAPVRPTPVIPRRQPAPSSSTSLSDDGRGGGAGGIVGDIGRRIVSGLGGLMGTAEADAEARRQAGRQANSRASRTIAPASSSSSDVLSAFKRNAMDNYLQDQGSADRLSQSWDIISNPASSQQTRRSGLSPAPSTSIDSLDLMEAQLISYPEPDTSSDYNKYLEDLSKEGQTTIIPPEKDDDEELKELIKLSMKPEPPPPRKPTIKRVIGTQTTAFKREDKPGLSMEITDEPVKETATIGTSPRRTFKEESDLSNFTQDFIDERISGAIQKSKDRAFKSQFGPPSEPVKPVRARQVKKSTTNRTRPITDFFANMKKVRADLEAINKESMDRNEKAEISAVLNDIISQIERDPQGVSGGTDGSEYEPAPEVIATQEQRLSDIQRRIRDRQEQSITKQVERISGDIYRAPLLQPLTNQRYRGRGRPAVPFTDENKSELADARENFTNIRKSFKEKYRINLNKGMGKPEINRIMSELIQRNPEEKDLIEGNWEMLLALLSNIKRMETRRKKKK